MKYDDDDNPKSAAGPALLITIGGPPEKKHAARKKVAKGKVKQKLVKMYDSWKPKTNEGKAYDSELKSLIDSMTDESH